MRHVIAITVLSLTLASVSEAGVVRSVGKVVLHPMRDVNIVANAYVDHFQTPVNNVKHSLWRSIRTLGKVIY